MLEFSRKPECANVYYRNKKRIIINEAYKYAKMGDLGKLIHPFSAKVRAKGC